MFPIQGTGCESLLTSLQGQSQLSQPPVQILLQIMSLPLKTNYICIQELLMFPFRLSFHPLTGELEVRGSDSLNASFPFHPLAEASCRFPCSVVTDAEWCLPSSHTVECPGNSFLEIWMSLLQQNSFYKANPSTN